MQQPPENVVFNTVQYERYLAMLRNIAPGSLPMPPAPVQYPAVVQGRWVVERDQLRQDDWPGWKIDIITLDDARAMHDRVRDMLLRMGAAVCGA